MPQNDVRGVTVATTGEAINTIATTTSGRITMTAVIVATTISASRNRMTILLLIAATRRASHALCTD
jgi:hypothetical protein